MKNISDNNCRIRPFSTIDVPPVNKKQIIRKIQKHIIQSTHFTGQNTAKYVRTQINKHFKPNHSHCTFAERTGIFPRSLTECWSQRVARALITCARAVRGVPHRRRHWPTGIIYKFPQTGGRRIRTRLSDDGIKLPGNCLTLKVKSIFQIIKIAKFNKCVYLQFVIYGQI